MLALLLVGIGAWFAFTSSEPRVGDANVTAARDRAEDAAAVSAAHDTNETAAPSRESAHDTTPTSPTAAPPKHVLSVRLRGLHPDAPWTTDLRLALDFRSESGKPKNDHDATAKVDAEGRAEFALPDWWPETNRGRIDASDPNYTKLEHRWDGSFDTTNELILDVQVTALLEGRVVDTGGNGVATTRLSAFAVRDGAPVDEPVATAGSRHDGTFRMKAPPAIDLLVVAQPMATDGRGRVLTMEDGSPYIVGDRPHATLLPATARTRGRVGAITNVPDIVVPDAASLRGVVRHDDGTPIHRAVVTTLPREGVTFRPSKRYAVQLHPDGALSPITDTETAVDGTFVLPAAPRAAVDVAVAQMPDARIVGGAIVHAATPAQDVDIVVPRPVATVVVDGGRRVPHAIVEIEDKGTFETNVEGELDLVVLAPIRARAASGALRSEWLPIAPAAAGTTVTIELQRTLAAVAIEFEGEFRVRNAMVDWRSADGRTGRQHLVRDDRSGPFEIFLEPGQYHLRIGPSSGERNGVFLLPIERDVTIASEPVKLALQAVFGGTFALIATDANGLHVAGTCRVIAPNGDDVTDHFVVDRGASSNQGTPGELMTGGPNRFTRVLPPGDYEVQCDFVEHGARVGRVTIRPREVTEVRLRL